MTRRLARSFPALAAGAALAVAAAACGGSAGPDRSAGSSGVAAARSAVASPSLVGLSERPVVEVEAGGRRLRLAVADDEQAWEQGLMGVTDLGSLDGMLFRFHGTVERAFWMKDTEVPLDIAFVGPSGTVLAVLTMPICRADPCPTYRAPAPYTMAVEAPAGRLGYLRAGDRLTVKGPAAS